MSIVHEGEIEAREHALTIDMHGARAALPMVATLLRSGECDGFAYAIQQCCSRINIQFVVLAIDTQRDRDRTLDSWVIDFAFARWFGSATRMTRQVRRDHTRRRRSACRF
jgi:hypothetical protein